MRKFLLEILLEEENIREKNKGVSGNDNQTLVVPCKSGETPKKPKKKSRPEAPGTLERPVGVNSPEARGLKIEKNLKIEKKNIVGNHFLDLSF